MNSNIHYTGPASGLRTNVGGRSDIVKCVSESSNVLNWREVAISVVDSKEPNDSWKETIEEGAEEVAW